MNHLIRLTDGSTFDRRLIPNTPPLSADKRARLDRKLENIFTDVPLPSIGGADVTTPEKSYEAKLNRLQAAWTNPKTKPKIISGGSQTYPEFRNSITSEYLSNESITNRLTPIEIIPEKKVELVTTEKVIPEKKLNLPIVKILPEKKLNLPTAEEIKPIKTNSLEKDHKLEVILTNSLTSSKITSKKNIIQIPSKPKTKPTIGKPEDRLLNDKVVVNYDSEAIACLQTAGGKEQFNQNPPQPRNKSGETKITCKDCGRSFRKSGISQHLKSGIHQRAVNYNTNIVKAATKSI